MCGRYTITASLDIILSHFHISQVTLTYAPRYNVAPGQMIPAIISGKNQERRLGELKWGLIPSWAKDDKMAFKTINAKAETLMEKPAFKQPFLTKRCMIPADGFYEWSVNGGEKQPMRFVMRSGQLFSFAGLYDTWISPKGEKTHTCTIITTQPNRLVRDVHNRMPVILTPEQESIWLDRSEHNPELLMSILRPYEADQMSVYPVAKQVGSVKYDDPACIIPIATYTSSLHQSLTPKLGTGAHGYY